MVDINCFINRYSKVTPLLGAARFGHNIVVQMLLDKGADPNKGSLLNTVARNRNRVSTARILLNGGADPNTDLCGTFVGCA